VCRSPFTAYLRKPVAGEETSGDDNNSNTGGVGGGMGGGDEGQVTSTVSPLAPSDAPAAGSPPVEGNGIVQAGWGGEQVGGGGGEGDLARARNLREEVESVQDVGGTVVVGAAGPGPSPGRTVSR